MKTPKAPKPTAQEVALERRQTMMLDQEIGEQEQRFKAMARGKLGQASLLGNAPRTRGEAAGGGGRASASMSSARGGSLVGGISGYSFPKSIGAAMTKAVNTAKK